MSTTKVPLNATADHPAVRIDVINDRYQTVDSGFGKLETELPRGLYTVRFSAGDSVVDEGVTLYPGFAPDAPVSPREPLRFSTAAPLSDTSTTREYHRAHAERLSGSVSESLGAGCSLLIFVRDLDKRGHSSPAAGLRLLDSEGKELWDIGRLSETRSSGDEDRWAGCNLELASGCYILRLDREDAHAVEMPLYTFPNRQTQVFATRATQRTGDAVRRPDLTSANIMIGCGFNSKATQTHSLDEALQSDVRLAELARQALESGQELTSRKDLKSMLRGKWNDPMTGLLAGHIVARRQDPDTDLLKTVIGNLTDLLGDPSQADLLALRIRLAQCTNEPLPDATVAFPPMLRQSWKLLIGASGVLDGLIPRDSLGARISGRLWGNSAWMIWQAPDPRKERAAETIPENLFEEATSQLVPAIAEALIGPLTQQHSTVLTGIMTPQTLRFGVPKSLQTLTRAFTQLKGISNTPVQPMAEVDAEAAIEERDRDTVRLLSRAESLLKSLDDGLDIDTFAEQSGLSSAEFQLLTFVANRIEEEARMQRRTVTSARRIPAPLPPASETYTLPSLVKTFGLPASVLISLAASLYVKLVAHYESV